MKNLRKVVAGFIIFTFVLGFSQAAHAQNKVINFDFASIDDGYDATGTLFVTPNPGIPGSYIPLSGDITVPSNSAGFHPGTYDLAIASAGVTLGPNPDLGSELFSSGNPFNSNSYNIQLTYNGGSSYYLEDNLGNIDYGVLKVAAVPELSSMLGFGSFVALGGLVLLHQRKQARNTA
jgi:hypothetical protein